MSKKNIQQKIVFVFLSFIITSICYGQKNLKLWYNAPANSQNKDGLTDWASDKEWLKALPVGNGFLGAMIFGDVNHERIQLNEKSLWSGSQDDNNNPSAADSLAMIRQLLF